MRQLVVVGDIHLHFWPAFAKGQGVNNSRFQNTLTNLRLSLDKARELKCPWVQAGDWIHTVGFSRNQVITRLIKLLQEYPDVEKFTVWGNHDSRTAGDMISPDESVTEVLYSSGVIEILNRGIFWSKNDIAFYGEGYQPNLEDLAIVHREEAKLIADVGLFHQTILGSELPSGMKMDHGLPTSALFPYFKLSIVGDIHRPQYFQELPSGHIVLVPGSLEQHNFGDLEERGWWVIDVDGVPNWGQPEYVQFVPASSPKFITVKSPKDIKEDGNFYRITEPCDPSEVPAGVLVLASPPTAIEQREAIIRGGSTRDVLEAWTTIANPPRPLTHDQVITEGLRLLESQGPVALKDVRLREVRLSHFLCYADATFTIKDGVTLVVGSSRDFASNGAGKTTLFEAIYWALFGKTTKGISSDDVIQRGEKECAVELIFDDLKVERSRRKNSGGVFKVTALGERWGVSPKEGTNTLEQYLGVTPELFQALAYFSQSRLVLFSQASDSERKEMLSDLCGLDVYQKAATAARSSGSLLEHEISRISGNTFLLERQCGELLEQCCRLEEKRNQWETVARETLAAEQQDLASLERCLNEIQNRWGNTRVKMDNHAVVQAAAVLQTKDKFEAEYRVSYEADLTKARQMYDEWRQSVGPLPTQESVIRRRAELSTELGEAYKLVLQTENQIELTRHHRTTLEQQIQELEQQPDECPTCGQPVPRDTRNRLLHSHRQQLQSREDDFKMLIERLEPLKKDHEVLKGQVKQLDDLSVTIQDHLKTDSLYQSQIRLAEKAVQIQPAEAALLEVRARAAYIKGKWQLKVKELGRAVASQTTLLREQIGRRQTRIAELTENPYADELEKSHSLLVERQGELERSKKSGEEAEVLLKLAQYWADGFSRTGIQSLLMDEIATSFNQIRSSIFPILTRGVYDVQFSTTSKTKEGEAREKTELVVRDRGALVSYESLSGGQRRRVDLGVMLTLSMAVAKTRQVPGVLGLLILDEVFGFLDSDGVEALYEVLGEVNRVIPAIYAVTHNPSLQSLFTTTILVTQDDHGVSSLSAEGPRNG
jgi:DNA repair exonuclease SbcCD ATPase subunit